MLTIEQPNLSEVIDVDSAYNAFLFLARQLPGKAAEILEDINTRILQIIDTQDQLRAIAEFTESFTGSVFQKLIERVAEISPVDPNQRDHPLRHFNHEVLGIPNNLSQYFIDKLLSGEQFSVDSIKPYLSYVLIKNRYNQVFVALASTKQPIWKC